MVPLTSFGDISERYTGTTIEQIPMANPTISLPPISIFIDGDTDINTDPAAKSTSDTKIVDLLPILSLIGPAISAPTNAPNSANDTTNSF